MVAAPERVMLLDTPSLYFRAFYGVPDSIRAPDGSPVNAVRGLLDFVARLTSDRSPTHLVACMDNDWRPTFRVDAIPSYKLHRVATGDEEQVPDALTPQVAVIEEVLTALGVPVVGVDGYEADDVIGTLATHSARPVDVVTGDRDLFQLVDDARGVRILYTARGVGRHDVVDEAWVAAKYGIPGRAYADFATLRGDPSDGLPGVPGVGEKTAAALVTRYGSLAGILAAVEARDTAMPAGARAKLLAAHDYLAVAPVVVAVATDVPVPAYDDVLPSSPRDPERLLELSKRWGLDSSLNRVLRAFNAQPTVE
ncbi:MAG: 5'-3' exonuclease [Spirochaetaceae bacterium]|nr:5'-3' exonuclease [Spirochaetaceae bacterium]